MKYYVVKIYILIDCVCEGFITEIFGYLIISTALKGHFDFWINTLQEEYPILTEHVVITYFWLEFTMVGYEIPTVGQNWENFSTKWYCRNILHNG